MNIYMYMWVFMYESIYGVQPSAPQFVSESINYVCLDCNRAGLCVFQLRHHSTRRLRGIRENVLGILPKI